MSLILDHRTTPAGVVPPHMQQWIVIGIVVVMAAILSFTGSPVRPRTTAAAAAPATVDANRQRIEEYQRRVEEQARRIAAEDAELQLAKKSLATRSAEAAAGASRGDRPPRGGAEEPSRGRAAGSAEARRPVADNIAFSRESSAWSRPTGGQIPVGSAPAGPPGSLPTGPGPTGPGTPAPGTPVVRYRLMEGTLIETVLTNRLDGTFTGPVNCLVTTAVYASDLQHLLIPAGSRVLGESRPVNTFGQSRLAVAFHRLVLPNLARVDLNGFHGLNQLGDPGLRDQVDRHYAQIFGASLAVGAIAGLAQSRTGGAIDATALDAYRQGAAANLAQSSAHILDRFLNILPAVTIREGHRIKVYLANDLDLPEYRDTRPASERGSWR